MDRIQDYKGVIFDLDGTLIDSLSDIRKFCNKVLARYDYPTHTLDKYHEWVGNGARKLVERALPSGFDPVKFEQIYAEYLHIYEHDEHTESVLYDGIPELLDRLTEQNIPFAICTNKPQKVMLKTIASYFSKWQFVSAVGQKDGEPRKPDPSGALGIAKLMGLSPDQVLFVGDSAVDVKTSNAAGMISICTTKGYETRENIIAAQPDYMIEEHKELLDLL